MFSFDKFQLAEGFPMLKKSIIARCSNLEATYVADDMVTQMLLRNY